MQQANKSEMLAVIVLYNVRLEDSATYKTLIVSTETSTASRALDIIVYDNSSESQTSKAALAPTISYVHDAKNGGVAKAYNYALDHARQRGYKWLLLLDQDSELPPDFIQNCWTDLRLLHVNPSIAAIVPTVYCGSTLISPCKVGWGGKVHPILVHGVQVPPYEITAINSGALVNVAFLESIGGFNNEFWLDMLDHWLFRTIYCNKMNVAIGSNKAYHDLSIHSYSTLSFSRYKNIITAENHFYITSRSVTHRVIFKIRLIIRVLKLIFIHNRADLSWLTLSYVFKGDT